MDAQLNAKPVASGAGSTAALSRWHDLAENPNAPEAVSWRLARLADARRAPVRDRVNYLTSLAVGQRVLDVGAVDHETRRFSEKHWLHAHLAGAAAECLGVDILPEAVCELQEAGYNIECRDLTDPSAADALGCRFDLMICGELIEHLENPGALFKAARRVIVPGGRLVLTTPNPFQLWSMGRYLLGCPKDNADHVLCFGPWHIAEFAERHGMCLDAYRGTLIAGATPKHRLAFRAGQCLQPLLKSEFFCSTIIYEIRVPMAS